MLFRSPVHDYPWRTYQGLFAWSVASAVPGVAALVLLRSPYLAIVCFGMLAPLIKDTALDFYQMAGEHLRGEVVTAQGGYHDCDRKGHNGDLGRFWLYLTCLVVALSTAGQLWIQRRRHITLKS